MPRRPRVFADGAHYHVYNHTARGESPFLDPREAECFVATIARAKARDGFSVLAWCLMSNHYHLLLRTGRVPLWRSMLFIQHRYSLAFNRPRRVTGPLWQSRYTARVIADQRDLDGVLAYIHLSPVVAGLCREPSSYRWSGHCELLGLRRHELVDLDQVLPRFGDDPPRAREAYAAMLGRNAPIEGVGWPPDHLGPLAERFGDEGVDGRRTPPPQPPARALTATEAITLAAAGLRISDSDIASTRRSPNLARARELIALLAVERLRIGPTALARALGRSPDCVGRWVTRATRRRARDPRFVAALDSLELAVLDAARTPSR